MATATLIPPGEICLLIAEGLVEIHKEAHRDTEDACDRCLLRNTRRDLLSLCLTSRDIRSWTEHVLYRDVRVNEYSCTHWGADRQYAWPSATGRAVSGDSFVPAQSLMILVDTLTTRPELRKVVTMANVNWSHIYDILDYRGLEMIDKVEALLPSTSRFQGLSAEQRRTLDTLPGPYDQAEYLEVYFTGLLLLIFPNIRAWKFPEPSVHRDKALTLLRRHRPPSFHRRQQQLSDPSYNFFSQSLDTEPNPGSSRPRRISPEERLSRWYSSIFSNVGPGPGNERLRSIEIIRDHHGYAVSTILQDSLPYITTLTLAHGCNKWVDATPKAMAQKTKLPNLTDLRLHAPTRRLLETISLREILGPTGFTNLTSFSFILPTSSHRIRYPQLPTPESPNLIISQLACHSPNLKRLVLDLFRPWDDSFVPDLSSLSSILPKLEVLVIDRSGWSSGQTPSFPASLRVLHLTGARGLPELPDPVSLELKLQVWDTTITCVLGSLVASVKKGTHNNLWEMHVEIDPDFAEPAKLRVESWERLLEGEVDRAWHMRKWEYRKKVEGYRKKMEVLRMEFAEMGVRLVVRSACTESNFAAFRMKWLPWEMMEE